MSSAPERDGAPDSVPEPEPVPDPVAHAILAAVAACPAGKTLCPSRIARALAEREDHGGGADAWRGWLKPVRRSAIALARAGRVGVYRKGRVLTDLDAVKGVIRLGPPPPQDVGGCFGG